MLRTAASKVAWVGRTASIVFGLALVMALVFGVASMALGANGQSFLLGRFNAATDLTKLTGNVNGSAMQVVNPNTGINDTALDLRVQSGEAPMRVNSTTRVANLNADLVDRQDSTALLPGGDLPRGRTVRGHYALGGNTPASLNAYAIDSISFGYQLASIPVARIHLADGSSGPSPTTECPGNINDPEAAPGFLCIYEMGRSNLVSNVYPTTSGGVTRNGARLYVLGASSSSVETFESHGTWAVTGN